MDKLSWLFELYDKITGPANAMAKALDKVRNAFKAAEPQRDALGQFLKVQPTLWQKMGASMGKMVPTTESLMSGLGGAITVIGGLAVAGLGLGAVGAKWAAESLSFQENSMIAFETILKSKTAADRVMKNAVAFAAATPFDTQGVIANMQQLLVAGFKESEINTVLAGAGDLGAAFGPEKQNQVIHAFQKIMAQGKLTGESIMMLGDAGVSVGQVYEQLGKSFGTTAKGAQAMISAGQIDSRSGIVASLNVIRDTISGGELGGMMAKQSKSLSGLWSSLTSRPFELLISADTTAGTDKIKAFLANLTDVLDPAGPTGKRIVGLFTMVGDAIGRAFGGASKGHTLEQVLNGILNVVEPLVKAFAEFGGGFMKGLAAGLKPLMDIFVQTNPNDVAMFAQNMTKLGEAAGQATAILVIGFGAIAAAMMVVGDVVGFLYRAFRIFANFMVELCATFIAFGIGIVDGLWTGITQGWGAMLAKFENLVNLLPQTVRVALGIHSPSKVFEQLGGFTAAGFVRGLEDGGMGAAMNDNARPPSFAGGINVGGGGGGGISLGGIHIQLALSGDAARDPQTVATAVGDEVEARVETMIDRLALASGA